MTPAHVEILGSKKVIPSFNHFPCLAANISILLLYAVITSDSRFKSFIFQIFIGHLQMSHIQRLHEMVQNLFLSFLFWFALHSHILCLYFHVTLFQIRFDFWIFFRKVGKQLKTSGSITITSSGGTVCSSSVASGVVVCQSSLAMHSSIMSAVVVPVWVMSSIR